MTVAGMTTERLQLRQWKDSDRDTWAAMNADPEVREFFPGLLSRAESDAFVDRVSRTIDEQGWGLWAAEVIETGEFVGFVGLSRAVFDSPITPATEVGWRLARPFWGHGYATEGALAALDFAFTELELEEVVSFTAVGNIRSRRVMERIGMRRDPAEDFDHPAVAIGHPLRRHALYRILASHSPRE